MPSSLVELAERGGLVPRGRAAWSPCPCCGAERRGRSDRRGPLGFRGETWRCHAAGCDAGGGAAALLAALRFRAIPPKGDPRWREVYAELEGPGARPSSTDRRARSGPAPARFVAPRPPQEARIASRTGAGESPTESYPPKEEVAALWNACVRLDRLPPTDSSLDWLDRRALSAPLLAQLDLARALPENLAARPRWLPRSAPAVHRLVVGMFDDAGELRSLRFRAVREPARPAKALPASGHTTRGLVMADSVGQALLRGARVDDDGMPWDGRVLVAEGETDFWTLAGDPGRMDKALADRQTFAVFGIVAGAWTTEIAARIPSGARVVVWTDLDAAGERYAEAVRASLASRCDVRRRRPTPMHPPLPGTPP